MEAELYAAAQGYNLLESISSVLQEIEPDAFDKVLAIDNSSAVSMCNGGPGSQRTRHLKVRASFIREAVLSGRLTGVEGAALDIVETVGFHWGQGYEGHRGCEVEDDDFCADATLDDHFG